MGQYREVFPFPDLRIANSRWPAEFRRIQPGFLPFLFQILSPGVGIVFLMAGCLEHFYLGV